MKRKLCDGTGLIPFVCKFCRLTLDNFNQLRQHRDQHLKKYCKMGKGFYVCDLNINLNDRSKTKCHAIVSRKPTSDVAFKGSSHYIKEVNEKLHVDETEITDRLSDNHDDWSYIGQFSVKEEPNFEEPLNNNESFVKTESHPAKLMKQKKKTTKQRSKTSKRGVSLMKHQLNNYDKIGKTESPQAKRMNQKKKTTKRKSNSKCGVSFMKEHLSNKDKIVKRESSPSKQRKLKNKTAKQQSNSEYVSFIKEEINNNARIVKTELRSSKRIKEQINYNESIKSEALPMKRMKQKKKTSQISDSKCGVSAMKDTSKFECPVCQSSFDKKVDTENHAKLVHGLIRVMCVKKSTCAASNSNLQVTAVKKIKQELQIRSSQSYLTFECPVCGIDIQGKAHVENHGRTVHGLKYVRLIRKSEQDKDFMYSGKFAH